MDRPLIRPRRARKADPAAPGANVGRRRGATALEPPGGSLLVASERFNASDAARLVAGLTRTLGVPRASVGAAAGRPGAARVTIAWELCWYQWAVDLVGPSASVVEVARGTEIAELDLSARQWNASVAASGRLLPRLR